MKKLMTGLVALAWLIVAIPMTAQAGKGTIAYKPGDVKTAIANGRTILLHYKSTW